MKRRIALLLVCLMCAMSGAMPQAYAETNTIKVYIEGHEIELLQKIMFDNEEVYLPLREILNACGVNNDSIIYDNGNIDITLTSTMIEQPVHLSVSIGKQGVVFSDDESAVVQNYADGVRMTTHPVILVGDIAYAPLGVFIKIKNYAIKNDTDKKDGFRISRLTYLNLLSNLEIRQFDDAITYYDVLLGNIDTSTDSLNPQDYYGENERVFIGNAAKQEIYGYHHKEINCYYFPVNPIKRILVDDENKVIAVVPIENQRQENLDLQNGDMTFVGPGWESVGKGGATEWGGYDYVCDRIITDPSVNNSKYYYTHCFYIPSRLVLQVVK